MVEKRLGRGLGSLLGPVAVEAASGAQRIALGAIRSNPHQPRRVFDPRALEELTDSIRRHGVLQPIVVRASGATFELIAGERRVRAAHAAGLTSIPALVRTDVADEQMLELALVENVQREDLDPIEKALGYRQLGEQLSLTQEQIADLVGLRRSTVTNHLRLLELPETAQSAVQHGLISMGHARALLGLENPRQIDSLIADIAREGLSVRAVEALVRKATKPAPTSGPAQSSVTPATPGWVRDLERRMSEHLGTKVSVRNGMGYRGQIVIDYFQRADLDRLCGVLAPSPGVR